MKIAIVNGANINLLGIREPEIYGKDTWDKIQSRLDQLSLELGVNLLYFQSNHEGDIVDFIQKNLEIIDGIIINPAGFSKTGYCILDAIEAKHIPYIEVHISNIFKRGGWHAESIFLEHANGQIIGLKDSVYELALRGMKDLIQ